MTPAEPQRTGTAASLLLHVVVFAIAGPPIGSVVVWIFLLLQAVENGASAGGSGFGGLPFFLLLVGYVIGGPSAVLTGLVVGILRRRGIARPRLAGGVVGALAAIPIGPLLFGIGAGGDGAFALVKLAGLLVAFALLPGFVAGFVSTMLTDQFIRRPG